MKTTLALALCTALAACGGGGDSPVVLTAKAASIPRTVKIAMYGDSTAYGLTLANGVHSQSPYNEPASLQWAMQQQFGPVVTVENHGVPGSTCPEILWGTAPVTKSWAVEMANSNADIVTANPGINDAFLPNESNADFTFCMGQLAQIAKQYGKTFVIETPNPIDYGQNANIGSLVHDEQSLGVPMIDQWNNIQSTVPNWATYLPDHVHPDDDLYAYKAQYSFLILKGAVNWYLTHS